MCRKQKRNPHFPCEQLYITPSSTKFWKGIVTSFTFQLHQHHLPVLTHGMTGVKSSLLMDCTKYAVQQTNSTPFPSDLLSLNPIIWYFSYHEHTHGPGGNSLPAPLCLSKGRFQVRAAGHSQEPHHPASISLHKLCESETWRQKVGQPRTSNTRFPAASPQQETLPPHSGGASTAPYGSGIEGPRQHCNGGTGLPPPRRHLPRPGALHTPLPAPPTRGGSRSTASLPAGHTWAPEPSSGGRRAPTALAVLCSLTGALCGGSAPIPPGRLAVTMAGCARAGSAGMGGLCPGLCPGLPQPGALRSAGTPPGSALRCRHRAPAPPASAGRGGERSGIVTAGLQTRTAPRPSGRTDLGLFFLFVW